MDHGTYPKTSLIFIINHTKFIKKSTNYVMNMLCSFMKVQICFLKIDRVIFFFFLTKLHWIVSSFPKTP